MKNNPKILTLEQINDRLDIMAENITQMEGLYEVLQKLVDIQKAKK
jgi:hypothetical protein